MGIFYQTNNTKEVKCLKKLGFKYTKKNSIYEFENNDRLTIARKTICQK